MPQERTVKKIKEYRSGKRNKYAIYECECGQTFRCSAYKTPEPRYCETCRGNFTSKYPRLYRIWGAMKSRCNNPNNHAYNRYGSRGIKVCDEWNRFNGFVRWAISNGYADNLTIERKDINKGYCPENCIWIPIENQSLNTAHTFNNRFLTVNGVTKTYKEWSEESGVNPKLITRRIREMKMTSERAISRVKLKKQGHLVTIDGKTQNITAWLKENDIPYRIYRNRLSAGIPLKEALTTPFIKQEE